VAKRVALSPNSGNWQMPRKRGTLVKLVPPLLAKMKIFAVGMDYSLIISRDFVVNFPKKIYLPNL
jgi:hypothetical protein